MEIHPRGWLRYNRRILRSIFLDKLNKGKRLYFFRSYLNWHLRYKYFKKSWIIQFENGYKSIVKPYPDHDAGEENIWTKNVDYYELAFIERIIPSNALIYDIGCNVGNRTLALAHKLSGAVLIDAGIDACNRTRENIEFNKLDSSNFQVLNYAIGLENKKVYFTNIGGANTQNQVVQIHNENVYEIQMHSIDTLMDELRVIPSFIKIDIEGQDIQALLGARKCLTSGQVKLIMFEHVRNEPLSDLETYFNEINWKMFAMDSKGKFHLDFNEQDGFNLFAAPSHLYLQYIN